MGIRRVLVTGGAGFIGSHLVEGLIQRGESVTVLDNFYSGNSRNLDSVIDDPRLTLVTGDIRSERDLKDCLKGVDSVVHLAAIKSVEFSNRSPELASEVNVAGTKAVLASSIRAGVKKFVLVSSCATYGEAVYTPQDEDHPTNPISPYGRSKLEAERACLASGFPGRLRIMRLFNVYGPRQEGGTEPNVIASFRERLGARRRPVIQGSGEQTRDFVHVRDVVQCLLRSLEVGDTGHTVFNVGSGTAVSINSLATRMIELTGRSELRPLHTKPREGDIARSEADIRRSVLELGFSPQVKLEAGLRGLE